MPNDRAGYRFAKTRNRGLRNGQIPDARISGKTKEQSSCEMTTASCVATDKSHAVSPAISLAVNPASSREKQITETQGNQSSNQSGYKSKDSKPNCYACLHRRGLLGDAHSECKNPRISQQDAIISPFMLIHGLNPPAAKRLNVSGSLHGIKSGWFMWPINFDPVWLLTCDGFEAKP